jgi:4-hydroxy-2-oxoheptanedioate aldolase
MNLLKEKLAKGKVVFGPFMKFTDPAAVEIAGLAGFDFVIIDMEHGPVTYENTQNLIRAAEIRNITPIIRVSENKDIFIQRALDIGAHGVQVPQISTPENAEYVVHSSKFHPHGERGVCRYVRAADFSATPKSDYFRQANTETITIIHIEGVEGIRNLETIVQVNDIDIIFLGPYDLSQSCGFPGEVDHPEVIKKMNLAVKLARQNGKVVGTFVENPESAEKWIRSGVQYISYAVDVGIYLNACTEIVRKTRTLGGIKD